MSQPPSNAVSSGEIAPSWAKHWGQVAPQTLIGPHFTTRTAKYIPYTGSGSAQRQWFSVPYMTNLLNENSSNTKPFYFTMPDGMLFRISPGGIELDVCLDNVKQITMKGGQVMVLVKALAPVVSPASPVKVPVVTPGPVSLYQAPPAPVYYPAPAYALPAQVTVPVDDTTLVLAGLAGVLVLGAIIVLL
jgi:hypothetical protein